MDATYVINHIREEVDGARGYLALFKELGDFKVMHMCVDELHHATYFIKNGGIQIPDDLMNTFNDVKRAILNELKKQGEIANGNDREQMENKIVQKN